MSELTALLRSLPTLGKELYAILEATPAAVKAMPDRIERSGLSVREFTAVLPLRHGLPEDNSLWASLRAIDQLLSQASQPRTAELARVPGIHGGRLMLFDDTDNLLGRERAEFRESSVSAQGPLVLSLVYDGPLDAILEELLEGAELTNILQFCAGFPDSAGPGLVARRLAWLKKARLLGGYFFSDISYQSRAEIDRAAQLWTAFREFHIARQHWSPAELRAAFKTFWKHHVGEPMPRARALERRVLHEERWSRRVIELVARAQRRVTRAEAASDRQAVRAVHAKHHGCVAAQFSVRSDIPASYRRGIFAEPRTYKAWIRLSNAASNARPDNAFDGRGCAIKVLGVDGDWLLSKRERDAASYPGDGECGHDFVLLSHPRFFAKDVKDFALLLGALSTRDRLFTARLASYFARRPRVFWIMLCTFLQRVQHPLDIPYYSATPYLLGDRFERRPLAVKYSLRPRLGARTTFAPVGSSRQHPNFLAKALTESLHPSYGEAIELDLLLHVSKRERPPVEDATADWSDATVVPVATISIARQRIDDAENLDRAERLVFSPWHALAVHQPLGSINRARLAAYRESARTRGALRGPGGLSADLARVVPRGSTPPPRPEMINRPSNGMDQAQTGSETLSGE